MQQNFLIIKIYQPLDYKIIKEIKRIRIIQYLKIIINFFLLLENHCALYHLYGDIDHLA